MSKIGPYNLGAISPELENFRDEITNAWNFGKFQYPTVTVVPTWTASKGEAVWMMPASGGTTLYFYRNTAWVAGWSVTV